jgi:hypothetical protein
MKPLRAPLILAALATLVAGCGTSRTNGAPAVAERLEVELTAHQLPPRWVACVPSRAQLLGRTVYRCNVDFGDPHIEAYCAVLEQGRLAYGEWRQPVQGRQNRVAAQRECARRLSAGLG